MSHVPMTLPGLVLAARDTRYRHKSTFVELDGGRILHAAGAAFQHSDDGGVTWSAESQRVDADGNPVGSSGASMVKIEGNRIGYAGMGRSDRAKPYGRVVFWRSDDGGQTWAPPVDISRPGLNTHMLQDVALRTTTGRIVIPVHVEMGQRAGNVGAPHPTTGKLVNNQWVPTDAQFHDPTFTYVYVCYSEDEGRPWQHNRDGGIVILLDTAMLFSPVMEASVAEVYPGRLLMMMRTGLGRHFQSWSSDNGETWTRPMPTPLASSTTPAQIRMLHNGHLLVVWNQESAEETRRGYNRTRISSAISRNGGSVWEFFQNIQSIHETTRVEPGPIRPTRAVESYFNSGWPSPERPVEDIMTAQVQGRWSTPSVFVMKDRVIVAHTHTMYGEDPVEAKITAEGGKGQSGNQKQKVLPIEWFYGGKRPADNPFLKRAHEATVP
ncbi:MAG: exo-alpha-sialidase [SAR202 cluster bacterium]|nr:exo-alpha-sialidase [SAR202 cluster bacterium]